MSGRVFYLDNPDEIGSDAILRALDVSVNPSDTITFTSDSHTVSRTHFFCKERRCDVSVAYKVASDNVYVDIRDSGDCWLRICLNRNDVIVLPANLFHRLTHETIRSGAKVSSIYCQFSAAGTIEERFTQRYIEDVDALAPVQRHTFRELICELCTHFYSQGWVTGTGGSITMKYGNRIYMTPSGVQKERIQPDELYMLDIEGNILSVPPQKVASKFPKLSDCSPLFLHCYRLRNAGAAIHSHDQTCVLITALSPHHNEFRISHQEMIKGIAGYGYHDELVVPIIDNTAHENELADSLEKAILEYPQSFAVLVRDHGIYVWGENWEQAKR